MSNYLIEKYLGENKHLKKGDIIEHPKFGKGTIVSVDNKTYSIPMVVAQFGKDKIARPISEFK